MSLLEAVVIPPAKRRSRFCVVAIAGHARPKRSLARRLLEIILKAASLEFGMRRQPSRYIEVITVATKNKQKKNHHCNCYLLNSYFYFPIGKTNASQKRRDFPEKRRNFRERRRNFRERRRNFRERRRNFRERRRNLRERRRNFREKRRDFLEQKARLLNEKARLRMKMEPVQVGVAFTVQLFSKQKKQSPQSAKRDESMS